MTESRDYLEMSFRSIECFKDGKLDAQELGKLLVIAERDGEIDDNEIRVLQNIISRIKPDEIDQAMHEKLTEIVSKVAA
ncbi:Uncharacterised protein [BD1-7 clade bacterium]|uniref:Co-chaperone DjlA N-terminal domain-containing protein n=1 Tax=BD1-7 clade bacterium TaxID=2029982 RepID=A0A5S9QX52_9GAMM|nr:Uncharacterised protein [BD1-7 clade bacterium]